MIEINLLPGELRPIKPTPWPKLLGLLGAGLFLLAETLGFVYYHFNLNPRLSAQLEDLKVEQSTKEALAKKADELRAEIDDYKLRAKTIIEIRNARIIWAKKLDQLVDLVPDYMWLEGITVAEGQAARKIQGATITLDCFSLGTDEKRISSFLRAIKSHPINKDIASISDPSYALAEVISKTGGKKIGEALKFKLVIELVPKTKPPAAPARAATPAAAPAPAPGPS